MVAAAPGINADQGLHFSRCVVLCRRTEGGCDIALMTTENVCGYNKRYGIDLDRIFAMNGEEPASAPEPSPAAEPEAVAPELPAAASDETDAADEFARIDCDSPRVDLGGASELSARIDALFRVRRSPALAAQLNKIYEHHESIPRYTT